MRRALSTRGSVVVILLLLLAVLGGPAWAAETRAGDTVVIPPGETIDDNLYATGGTITIDGTVRGNLVAAGGQITINGTVEGNVYAAGQTLVINGKVEDVVAATQALQLGTRAAVGRSIVNFGYSFESLQGSSVQGDLLFYGSQALLAGSIGKDVKGGMNGFELRGSVGRNVDLAVGGGAAGTGQFSPSPIAIPGVSGGLRVTESAQIGGSLNYEGPKQGDIASGAKVVGPVNWRPSTGGAPIGSGGTNETFSLLDQVERLVALLLVGLLLVWLAPRWMDRLGDAVRSRPLPTLGRGVLAFLAFVLVVILLPIVAILLAVLFGLLTLDGLAWMLGIVGVLGDIGIIIAFLVYVGYIAQALISFVIGRWLLGRFQPRLSEGRALPLVVGAVIFVIITAIPIVGGLAGLVAALLALGALWRWLRSDRSTPATGIAPTSPPLPAAS